MTARMLVINNCGECPHRRIERDYAGACAEKWVCYAKSSRGRKIAGYIEWSSEEPKEIPEWCPLPAARDATEGTEE